MEPFSLHPDGLLLDQLTGADLQLIALYCSDPVFEQFMTTPWPYSLADAESFVGEYVPAAWANGSEWTWAIRRGAGGELLGVISLRLPSGMIGFWLGAPHRGSGIMSAATEAVVGAAFTRTPLQAVKWEAHVGNIASLRTAQRAGFSYTGEHPGAILGRDGNAVQSWTAEIQHSSRDSQALEWPA